MPDYDAIVVGSGPNGLAAAVALAQRGCSVLMLEARATIGGGCRSAELTLPGFTHDICSAIHPLGLGSPFFRTLPLEKFGLEWIQPDAPLAHPFDDGTALTLERSVTDTATQLGADAQGYLDLMGPLVPDWDQVCQILLEPWRLPLHPVGLATFGLKAILSARTLTETAFRGSRARALFSGLAAHSILPLEWSPSGAFGLALGISGHAVGWPLPRGGSQKIADALAAYFLTLGGKIETGVEVASLSELPSSRVTLCDISPRQFLRLGGDRLPEGYRRQLTQFQYGPAAFKIDWALDGPIPWRASGCLRSATVHLGATRAEIMASERAVWNNGLSETPYCLIAQQSLFDSIRAPEGKHTAWGYCHVPHGWAGDATDAIESQIERFAPGFRDLILAKHIYTPAAFEAHNPNYIGGDIGGGAMTWPQLFTRPTVQPIPWATPIPGLYLCSASTPPGAGVHGMCGYYAAMAAWLQCLR